MAAAIYILVIVITVLVKAVAVAIRVVQGYGILEKAGAVDWGKRLAELENPAESYAGARDADSHAYGWKEHKDNLLKMAADGEGYPSPSEIYNAVIIATYNEGVEVLRPTIEAVRGAKYDNKHIIVVLAYEQRGGEEVRTLAKQLRAEYREVFFDFVAVEHPDGVRGEVIGKGANITHAGRALAKYLARKRIANERVIVTTLDSDNRPSEHYFSYLTYEYIVREDRERLSYQPVSLFMNNIWDAPAVARVIAVGNSFWHLTSSLRPHSLRNFAAHAQPMSALAEMNFWSVRTIVEDGHQYWRSLFHFRGDYAVLPLRVPIYQDAVLSDTLFKTIKAQFIQLRRWYYGASDVAYVGVELCSSRRRVSFAELFPKFVRLLDSHVTLAVMAPIVAFGAWVPLLLNPQDMGIVVYQLPQVVAVTQQIAMVGLLVTVLVSMKMLPKRPEKYKKRRSVFMVLQWVLMPVTSIAYNSLTAFYSQTRLMLGKYMERFDVTEKVVKK